MKVPKVLKENQIFDCMTSIETDILLNVFIKRGMARTRTRHKATASHMKLRNIKVEVEK